MIYNQLVIGVLIPLLFLWPQLLGAFSFFGPGWVAANDANGEISEWMRDLKSAEKTWLENGRRQENHDHYPLVN